MVQKYMKNMFNLQNQENVTNVINKLKMFGDDKASLYHLDQDLGKREYKTHSYKI